jgi:hypothetical protein
MKEEPMKRFAAEVLFLNPDDVPRAVEALAAADCEFTYDPESIDPCGPTVFGMVTGTTELDEDAVGHWVAAIIRPGGDVVQWAYGEPWKIGDTEPANPSN